MTDWRKRYQQAHDIWFAKAYPVANADGHCPAVKYPKAATANGKNRIIIDFITWNGFLADRTNSMGVPMVQKIPRYSLLSGQVEHTEKVTYRRQNSRDGRGDVTAILHGGIYHLFETKTPNDRLLDTQKDFHARVFASGGKVHVIGPIEDFFAWWDRHMQDWINNKCA